jgi:hypothetical protein
MKWGLAFLLLCIGFGATAQKVESIHFNLYTDSLKKGVHNYINLDGKMSNGSFYPLMSDEVVFSSSFGKWEGNSIILDSSFTRDSVVITAHLKSNPAIQKTITVYMKRNLFEGVLKTEKELMEEWKQKGNKKPGRST